MKKYFLIALLGILLLAVGCSAEPMQPVDYAQAVMDNAQEYFDVVESLTISETSKVPEKDVFKERCKEAEAILVTVEKLSAPEEYSELHDKLCSGIEKERKWLELVEELYYSAGDREDEIVAEINELVSDPVFPATVLEIAKAVDDDTDGAFLNALK